MFGKEVEPSLAETEQVHGYSERLRQESRNAHASSYLQPQRLCNDRVRSSCADANVRGDGRHSQGGAQRNPKAERNDEQPTQQPGVTNDPPFSHKHNDAEDRQQRWSKHAAEPSKLVLLGNACPSGRLDACVNLCSTGVVSRVAGIRRHRVRTCR